ncbi:hypothetical protein HK098_001077 [Nowakowskiella sp. JEL0407]|nr:hypothetical protein HK098_001077 [Nowakowskiella sp. JEL0407]
MRRQVDALTMKNLESQNVSEVESISSSDVQLSSPISKLSLARDSVELRAIAIMESNNQPELEGRRTSENSTDDDIILNPKKLPWFLKYRAYLTDFYLTIYLAIVGILTAIYCVCLIIFDPELSPSRFVNINDPTATVITQCSLSSLRMVIVPYLWIFFFIFIGNPVMIFSIRKIRDNYKIKRDLMISSVVAALIFPLTLVWNFVLPKSISYSISGSILMSWIMLMVVNTVCVLLPVLEVLNEKFKKSIPSEDHSFQPGLSDSIAHQGPKLTKSSFEFVLKDPNMFDQLKSFASRDFTTENVLFIKAYLTMVEQVLSWQTNNSQITFAGDFSTTSFFQDDFRMPSAAIPSNLFPLYRAIYDTFFKPGSDLELNLPAKKMSKIRRIIILGTIANDQKSGRWIKRRLEKSSGTFRRSRRLEDRSGHDSLKSGSEISEKSAILNNNKEKISISPTLSEIFVPPEKEIPKIDITTIDYQPPDKKLHTTEGSPALEVAEGILNYVEAHSPQIKYLGGSISEGIEDKSFGGIPADLYDEAFRDVLEMLYLNTYSKWVKSKRVEEP